MLRRITWPQWVAIGLTLVWAFVVLLTLASGAAGYLMESTHRPTPEELWATHTGTGDNYRAVMPIRAVVGAACAAVGETFLYGCAMGLLAIVRSIFR